MRKTVNIFIIVLTGISYNSVGSEILLSKMIWCHGMDFGSQNFHLGKGGHYRLNGVRSAEQIGEDDVVLDDIVFLQYVHRLDHSVAGAHNWIHEQNLPILDIVWETSVNHGRFVRFSIRFDQDFSDSDRPTAVAQALLHRLAASDDAHSNISLLVI